MLIKFLNNVHKNKIAGSIMRKISKRFGDNIIEKDWDIAIVIDAASYKIINELKHEYDYIEECDSIWSRGSKSSEWAQNTFIEDNVETENIDYVNGNSLSGFVTNGIQEKEIYRSNGFKTWMVEKSLENNGNVFNRSYDLWKKECDNLVDSDEEYYLDPKIVTKRAVNVINNDNNRTIIHYMQPHTPFIEADEKYRTWFNDSEYSKFNMSNDDYKNLVKAYKDNHRYILNHLPELFGRIDNDLEVVMTSDHGNMFGKIFGRINYAFGHPEYIWFERNVRKVPYVTIDQSTVKERNNVKKAVRNDVSNKKVIERLEDLGYK